MANVIEYDPFDTIVPDRVTNYIESANTPDYVGNPNTLINPDLSGVSGVEQKYWKVDTGAVVEMTTGEKDSIDEEKAENDEAGNKQKNYDKNFRKYGKMLKRLERKAANWGMTDTDTTQFVEDLLTHADNLKEQYCHDIDSPLIAFIDGYDSVNPLFTQAIQDELIGIID